ncbi:MAG TPA: hypothetical protein VGB94_14880 [Acidobacteriaceae bacterium]
MDSVRFGRALGKSARAAARGLYEAVDAASSPNPNPARPVPPAASQSPRSTVQQSVKTVAQGAAAYTRQKKAVAGEAGRLGRSLLAPFARAGKALWLEVTGTFYAIFAAFFVNYAWRLRGALRSTAVNSVDHQHFLAALVAAAVFLYFTITAFVRARRIQRPRA